MLGASAMQESGIVHGLVGSLFFVVTTVVFVFWWAFQEFRKFSPTPLFMGAPTLAFIGLAFVKAQASDTALSDFLSFRDPWYDLPIGQCAVGLAMVMFMSCCYLGGSY